MARRKPPPRDTIAIFNERVKSMANFLSSLGIGLIAFAVIRPALEGGETEGAVSVAWGSVGLAIQGIAIYILRYLKRSA